MIAPERWPSYRMAIIIPAYGRGPEIAGTLALLIAEAAENGLDVGFFVSDDTPDSSVEDPVRAVGTVANPVHYRRNVPALRHDRNLVASLLWPDADHVWLLGSSRRVIPGQLRRIMDFLDGQDLLLVNSHSPDRRMIRRVQGDESRSLLREALWHQTMTGTTIYGRRICDWARAQGDALVVKRNFPQISVIAGFASDHEPITGWFGEPSLMGTGSTDPSYWRATAIDVFVHDWAAVVTAFPRLIPPAQRTKVIGDHSRQSRLFDTAALIDCRRTGQLQWSSLRRPWFLDAMHEPVWKILLILSLPPSVAEAGKAALLRLKGR